MTPPPAARDPGRILVIRGGALGDFLLTLPVLTALRERFPRVHLEVLGYPHITRLALAGGLADRIHPIEARALAGFFARGGALDPATADFFAGFALILSFLYDPDGIFRENVARCSTAQFLVGPHRPDPAGSRHAADTFLDPLQRLAIFDADGTPRLAIAPDPPGAGPWLAVHPGSGSETKNWPEHLWTVLLQRVAADSDWRVLVVGGEAEADRVTRLAAALPRDRVRVARSLPLDQLAALLRGCRLFIGHDSGITHLAAALGLPSVALWGPSNPVLWRPRGDDILVLQDDAGLNDLPAETVWQVVWRHLAPRTPPSAATAPA